MFYQKKQVLRILKFCIQCNIYLYLNSPEYARQLTEKLTLTINKIIGIQSYRGMD